MVFNVAEYDVESAEVDLLAEVLEGVGHLDVRADHLEYDQTEAINIKFVRFFLIPETFALLDLRLPRLKQRQMAHAQVSDLDVAVV